jgi:hypothetical protein
MIFFILILLLLVFSTNVSGVEVVFKDPEGEKVSVNRKIVIVFSEEMMEGPTISAYSISPNVDGEFELNYNTLIFTPKDSLKPDTKYTITISTVAQDVRGNNLTVKQSWSFTTEKAESDDLFSWNNLEPIITGVTIAATGMVGIFGIYQLRKRRSLLRKYLERLDNVYTKYKHDPALCEDKLLQLKDALKAKVKLGEVEEYHFIILDKKIDDYRDEVRPKRGSGKPKIVKIIDQ